MSHVVLLCLCSVADLRRIPEGAMAPKSLKLPVNDLEQLYQMEHELLGPLRKIA